jgi:5-methylcytosine-specific restriction endonuclease McrA
MTLQRKHGIKIPKSFATFDHVMPRSLGGTCYHTNLKLAHRSCNNARNDKCILVAS